MLKQAFLHAVTQHPHGLTAYQLRAALLQRVLDIYLPWVFTLHRLRAVLSQQGLDVRVRLSVASC